MLVDQYELKKPKKFHKRKLSNFEEDDLERREIYDMYYQRNSKNVQNLLKVKFDYQELKEVINKLLLNKKTRIKNTEEICIKDLYLDFRDF